MTLMMPLNLVRRITRNLLFANEFLSANLSNSGKDSPSDDSTVEEIHFLCYAT